MLQKQQMEKLFMEEKDSAVLRRSQLFSGIGEKEIAQMLGCLSAERRKYGKDEFVFRCGESVGSVGFVLSGGVNVVKEDYWGNRNIVAAVPPGETFAESYACAGGVPLGVSVQASQDSEVLLMDLRKILTVCSSACVFHARLVRNLVSLLASRNLLMNEKLTHLTQRSTREKLLSYLSAESARRHSPEFEIPFDRQELADYLSVDRSAMSNELSKMRAEGILEYRRNRFRLLRAE
jgi:CRP-like cAMP-binding protein